MTHTAGAFPKWVMEALGTMFFTMTMCSAWSNGSVLHNSLAVGVSWALIHSVFNSHCDAHFNPLLTVGDFVRSKKSDRNFLTVLQTIFAQYVGCAVGICLLEKLAGSTDISASAAKSGAQEYIMLFVLAAFLVKFFWADGKSFYSEGGKNFDGIWYAVAIAVVHMIGNSSADANMANPAVYTGAGVQNVISSIFDSEVEFDAFGFFSTQLLQNLSMYLGAIVSVLATAWQYEGK